jgi:hypothetical protein
MEHLVTKSFQSDQATLAIQRLVFLNLKFHTCPVRRRVQPLSWKVCSLRLSLK